MKSKLTCIVVWEGERSSTVGKNQRKNKRKCPSPQAELYGGGWRWWWRCTAMLLCCSTVHCVAVGWQELIRCWCTLWSMHADGRYSTEAATVDPVAAAAAASAGSRTNRIIRSIHHSWWTVNQGESNTEGGRLEVNWRQCHTSCVAVTHGKLHWNTITL